MDSRGTHIDLTDGGRRAGAVSAAAAPGPVDARTARGLSAIVRRARGWTCDVRAVALDDQTGTLHVPLLEKVDRRAPSTRVAAGELIVRRVEEFAIDGPARTRWFELGRLAYDRAIGRVTIGPDGRSQFAVIVEALDVTLRIRPQTRPPA